MLVKIKAIILKRNSNKSQDFFINPDYIQNASFRENPTRLELKMSDGVIYLVLHSSWIWDAGNKSPSIKLLYDEFVHFEKSSYDKEYDRWIDEKAELYGESIGRYPTDW